MEWFEKLKSWLEIKDTIEIFEAETNSYRGHLSKAETNSYRGCYSTKAIKAFEPIVRVKSKYFIEYSQIEKKFGQIPDLEFANSLVAYYLMIEDQDPDSLIRSYLDSLPKSTESFDLSKELKQIEGLVNGHKYLDYLESLESDAFALYTWHLTQKYYKIELFDEFYSKYIHYRYLVGSRIFGYERNGIQQSGLVPYIDMFNHSFEPNSIWDI